VCHAPRASGVGKIFPQGQKLQKLGPGAPVGVPPTTGYWWPDFTQPGDRNPSRLPRDRGISTRAWRLPSGYRPTLRGEGRESATFDRSNAHPGGTVPHVRGTPPISPDCRVQTTPLSTLATRHSSSRPETHLRQARGLSRSRAPHRLGLPGREVASRCELNSGRAVRRERVLDIPPEFPDISRRSEKSYLLQLLKFR